MDMFLASSIVFWLLNVSNICGQKRTYCDADEIIDKEMDKLITHVAQAKECKKGEEGRPEAPLLKLCHQSVRTDPKLWRKGTELNIWDSVCKSNLGPTVSTPIAIFDGRNYKMEGGAAILRFCGHDGIYVLNQWCGKKVGFSWHFLPNITAQNYYRVVAAN
uniref:Uncharacterized protein n=1 Tax=Romanomermis culicivorax TaxID=13658 RepID=A0A915HRY8_ROMCU